MSEKSEKDKKAFQSYLDNRQNARGLSQTGKEEGFGEIPRDRRMAEGGIWAGVWSRRSDLLHDRACRRCQSQHRRQDREVVRGQKGQVAQGNAMVTHRVRISDPKQIDAEVLAWLKQAYDAA
jgi:hypothetical protein